MVIETIISVILLFVGILNGTADWFIASGIFSIASYIGSWVMERGRK